MVTEYWTIINPGVALEDYKIEETNHSGTLTMEAMAARRLTWQTTDDGKPQFTKSKIDKGISSQGSISLEPQRIRTYLVAYVPGAKETLFMQ